MPSILNAEHYIVIPASLAATLGLEEAVLLQVIGDLQRFSHTDSAVVTIAQKQLATLTPFWDDMQRRNVLNSLQAKGVIEVTFSGDNVLVAPFKQDAQRTTVVKEQTTNQQYSTAAALAKPSNSAIKAMTPDWQPRTATYDALTHNHGIPKSFAAKQLDEFRLYWQDRQTTAFSWDSKFLRHVLHAWRNQPATPAEAKIFDVAPDTVKPLTQDWQPSTDAINILVRSGVSAEFIESTVPEFILYWRERGDSLKTWNSKFVAHIRRQWSRFQSALVHDTEPHIMPKDWQPSEDTYDIIAMANINRTFAEEQIAAFVLFWRESNQLHKSWNSKFLQHVKYQWSKQLQNHENTHQSANGSDSRGFIEKHSDTSWTNGL